MDFLLAQATPAAPVDWWVPLVAAVLVAVWDILKRKLNLVEPITPAPEPAPVPVPPAPVVPPAPAPSPTPVLDIAKQLLPILLPLLTEALKPKQEPKQ